MITNSLIPDTNDKQLNHYSFLVTAQRPLACFIIQILIPLIVHRGIRLYFLALKAQLRTFLPLRQLI